MANREVIALNETTPQLLAPQAGDQYYMPRALLVNGIYVGDSTNTFFDLRSTNKFNIFIGFEAGLNSATAAATAGGAVGTANTAVGYQSQRAATTDSRYNSSFGTHSGTALTSGAYNTLIGANAGLVLTTGASNTVVGHDAMSTGAGQVAVTNNVFVGKRAGAACTASSTVGIGFEALDACTGTFNTAVGSSAGGACTSGGSNLFFGLGAGSTLTTGSQNIFLGVYAEPSAVGVSNEMVIGSQYTGIRQVYIGTGVTYTTPVATTINATGQSGTDKTGVDLSIAAGKGTGSGEGGAVRIKAAPAGSTGTTLGTLADVLVVYPTKVVGLAALTVATLPAAGTAGRYSYVTDGDAALAWGATVINSGAGATKYLVWDNGTNWTVAGK
jgi:hypothetical protein